MDPFNQDYSCEQLRHYIFEEDSESSEIGKYLCENKNHKFSNYGYDVSWQEPQSHQFVSDDKGHQTDNQFQLLDGCEDTETNREETENSITRVFKNKIIHKLSKGDTKKHKPKIKKEPKKAESKQAGNKSRFNNMGGFLIGSFSEILNKKKDFKFQDGHYMISVSGQWIKLSKTKLSCESVMVSIIKKLKREVYEIPRKDGAKKHLFRLINNGSKDTDEKRECKELIRQEILYSMNQEQWLRQHAYSRDFQPKEDDQHGTKKIERHEAYLAYLKGIRESLRTRGQLPKRLTL